ncbi:MAG: SOS response-associated peptidase [Gammaproteobacteria bacterium]
MCGRYASVLPAEAVARLFRTSNPIPNAAPSWNIAPSQAALVVRRHPETGARHLDLLRWGFLPHWTKDAKSARRPVNARAESAAQAPMFRGALAHSRCLVPATAFYEWQRDNGRRPFAVASAAGEPLALAGLWDGWRAPDGEVVRSFAILTVAANAALAPIHERMPAVIEAADWPLWLGERAGEPARLLQPAPDRALRIWPVATRVNTVANNDAGLLEPVAEERLR